MSDTVISHSPDLQRLREEGYDLEVREGYLIIRDIPYVNSKGKVAYGILVSNLTLNGDVAQRPEPHTVNFSGEYPCHFDGREIEQIRHQTERKEILPKLWVNYSFSNKPAEGYKDYYEKMTTYINILAGPAQVLDPAATPKTFTVVETSEEDSVFKYQDTASSRVGITMLGKKLALDKVAIVGLGGTGSYVLDLIAKSPVKEIHLFDGDTFASHNAFRSPGAASVEELRLVQKKVDYYKEKYSKLRWHIVAHPHYIDASNLDALKEMNFVFLCADKGEVKKQTIPKLEEWDISFIDVGMSVDVADGALGGLLRVTTSTPQQREHIHTAGRISFGDGGANEEYDTNIQIVDLNAFNATLAVIKWKKLCGFYQDSKHEHHTLYPIDGSLLINEDLAQDT